MQRIVHSLLLLILFAPPLQAQDVHLSHIHASPILLNPGMTGLFNGDMRLIANARSQWQSVTKGYQTVTASADARLMQLGRNDIVAGGIQLYSDKAGDLDFTTRSASVMGSVLKSLSPFGNSFLSAGISLGFVGNSVNYSNIVAFDNEPAIANGANDRTGYLDVSAGLSYFYSFDRDNSFHLGAAVQHLNKPNVSFFSDGPLNHGLSLYRKLVIHGGGDFRLSGKTFMKPTFIFLDQGPHREMTMGTFMKYKTLKYDNQNKGTAIYVGAWLRWYHVNNVTGTDAIIAAVRMDYKSTFITFSFDLNISTLTDVSYGRGGPELSIVKILDYKRTNRRSIKVQCPDF
ncbi:MAG: PorP/SprF family type IX secretion system membrane protein [Bacteroidota bacterium]